MHLHYIFGIYRGFYGSAENIITYNIMLLSLDRVLLIYLMILKFTCVQIM